MSASNFKPGILSSILVIWGILTLFNGYIAQAVIFIGIGLFLMNRKSKKQ